MLQEIQDLDYGQLFSLLLFVTFLVFCSGKPIFHRTAIRILIESKKQVVSNIVACLWLPATLRKSRFPGGLSKTADFKIFKPGAARSLGVEVGKWGKRE